MQIFARGFRVKAHESKNEKKTGCCRVDRTCEWKVFVFRLIGFSCKSAYGTSALES